jgi:hypothetical protein
MVFLGLDGWLVKLKGFIAEIRDAEKNDLPANFLPFTFVLRAALLARRHFLFHFRRL